MKLTSLLDKAEKELVTLAKKTLAQFGSACLVLGKILFAMQRKAPAGVSMSKYILGALGVSRSDIPSVSWSVARCCEYIGTGAGHYAEEDLDKTPASWLAVASAIFGLLDKAENDDKAPMDAAKVAGYREQVAEVIRSRPGNGLEVLKALRDSLKPEKKDGGAGGAGEGETETTEEIPGEEMALAAMKEAARLLAESNPDTAQCAVFRRLAISIGRIAKLKAKTAPPAPVAPLAIVEGNTLAPVTVEEAKPARRAPRRAGKTPAGVTPIGAVMEQAQAAA
jgi:hypothetical protein